MANRKQMYEMKKFASCDAADWISPHSSQVVALKLSRVMHMPAGLDYRLVCDIALPTLATQ
jgi:hypothetical protein